MIAHVKGQRIRPRRRAAARRLSTVALAAWALAACGTKVPVYSPAATISLPGNGHGPGIGDMTYSGELRRFIVPAGDGGRLYLIDPGSNRVTDTISAAGGRGVTSAVYGLGFVFAGDPGRQDLVVIDARSREVLARRRLAAAPDVVRYAASQKEVWVTEPAAEQIEIFRVHPSRRPVLSRRATIAVPGGPESLAIDDQRDMAYTDMGTDKTVAVDLIQERIIGRWPDTCKQSRGLALAPERGLLFVGCHGGRVASLDVAHHGTLIGSVKVGEGVDAIAYDAANNRLYVPAAASGMLTVLSSAPSGRLQTVAKYRTARGAHCVVSDGAGDALVCDPDRGRLLVIRRGSSPGG